MTKFGLLRSTRALCLDCPYAYAGPRPALKAKTHATDTFHRVHLDTGEVVKPDASL